MAKGIIIKRVIQSKIIIREVNSLVKRKKINYGCPELAKLQMGLVVLQVLERQKLNSKDVDQYALSSEYFEI